MKSIQLHFNLNYIVAGVLEEVILNLKQNKSSGNDNITGTLVKKCKDEIMPIWLLLINTAIYPDVLKIQKVIPIPTEINAHYVGNYRSVSGLSTVYKIIEKLLYDQLQNYLEENNLLL